jgi:hypothetical protein
MQPSVDEYSQSDDWLQAVAALRAPASKAMRAHEGWQSSEPWFHMQLESALHDSTVRYETTQALTHFLPV